MHAVRVKRMLDYIYQSVELQSLYIYRDTHAPYIQSYVCMLRANKYII